MRIISYLSRREIWTACDEGLAFMHKDTAKFNSALLHLRIIPMTVDKSASFPLERDQPDLALDIRRQVDRILSHELFARARRLSQLFRFAVEKSLAGEAHLLKEYTFGVDVFGRSEAFDCRMDSIVRVEVSRLRRKLDTFYETAGKNDRIVITLPASGYIPRLTIIEPITLMSTSGLTVGILDYRRRNEHLFNAPQQSDSDGVISLSYASLSNIQDTFDMIVVRLDQSIDAAERRTMIEAVLAKSSGSALVSDLECLDVLSSLREKLRTAWNITSQDGELPDDPSHAPSALTPRSHLVA
jgi:hypothetical protein